MRKLTYKIPPCEYRCGEDCVKDLANGTGDIEPCDYCNAEEIIAETEIADKAKEKV